MLSLGFVTAIVPELALAEVFELAAELGFDCIEVMCWPRLSVDRRYAGVSHFDAMDHSESVIRQTKELIRSTGVQISGLGYYPNCLDHDPQVARGAVEHLRRVMQAAAALELELVNTFIGRDHTQSIEDNWPRMLDTWGPLMELADSLNLKIGIENCPMLFSRDEWPGGKNLAHSPAIWRKLFAELGSLNLGLNYDPSHLVWQQIDYLAAIREFGPRIWHVHAKDVKVDWQRLNQVGTLALPSEYHTPRLPGLGEVGWGQVIAALLDAGFCGAMCIEVEDRNYEDSLENRRRALGQSLRYLRQFT
jgi:sugar phosphate isomerase/epimerase